MMGGVGTIARKVEQLDRWEVCTQQQLGVSFVSSDRSSYSDSVLLLVHGRQLFQILSIYANLFSFSF